MPRFRKRPVEVEAAQWFPGTDIPGVFGEREATPGGNGLSPEGPMAFVRTIHGQVTRIAPGDWVVTEPDGQHHYPVKPDIFEATYEPVSSSSPAAAAARPT
jgi:hypothetical protein